MSSGTNIIFGSSFILCTFYIDIIGEVFELGQIQTVQVHDKDRKETSVSDAWYQVSFVCLFFMHRWVLKHWLYYNYLLMIICSGLDVVCCLWGKYAEQFEEYIEGGNDQMLICLIRFAKNNIFRGIILLIKVILYTANCFILIYKILIDLCQIGSVQITNGFDASIVTLNPTMQEAIDFKQKLVHNIFETNIQHSRCSCEHLWAFFNRLLQDELPLSIVEKKNDKEMIKKQEADWNEIEVRFISEILVAYEVILLISVIFMVICLGKNN